MHTVLVKEKPLRLGDKTLKSADIIDGLNAIQDKLVIVNIDLQEFVWCSDNFLMCFPAISKEFISFVELFSDFEGLVNRLKSEKNMLKISLPLSGSDKVFEVSVCYYQENKAIFRFVDLVEKHQERQRYLDDREKLFSTSRTISVSEMATTLAHEINQPIGTVSNLLRGVYMRMQKSNIDDPLLKVIEKAIEQTTFISNIISRIREYTHSRRPQFENLSVFLLVNDCLSLLDWEIAKDNIKVKHHNKEKNIIVMGDKTMLLQVFVNLLRNAIDAMKAVDRHSRKIVIDIYQSNGYVEITLKDSGVGLTKGTKENLFVPFKTTKSTGMGVGLNICRSFVELHQGKLWLSPNNSDNLSMVGSTAYLRLPTVVS